MKKLVSTLTAILGISTLAAQDVVVKGPDEKLQLAVFVQNETKPCYSVSYNGKTMLEKSPLGMNTNIGDFTKNLKLTGHSVDKIDTVYPVSYTHLDVYKRQVVINSCHGREQLTISVS